MKKTRGEGGGKRKITRSEEKKDQAKKSTICSNSSIRFSRYWWINKHNFFKCAI